MKAAGLRTAFVEGHFRVWAGSFFLAAILWFLVISEHQYTYVIQVPIEVRNIKEGKTLRGEVARSAEVRFRATGRALLKTMLLKSISDFKLVLDLERISTSYDFYLNDYFDKYSQKVVIPSGFELEFIEVVRPDSIHISLDDYMEKRVKVTVDAVVESSPGFIQVGNLRFNPDSVRLAGPKEVILPIESVRTRFQKFVNLQAPLKAEVPLDLEFPRVVESSHHTISLFADIQSIGERIISEIPVEVINKPEKIHVFSSPSTVSLTITGGIDYIADVSADDIRVYVDFRAQWIPSQLFYPPIVEVPEDVLEWRDLSPKNIELVLTKIRE